MKSSQCRFCHSEPETLSHVLSSCKALSFTDHLERHNDVALQILHDICKSTRTDFKNEWWRGVRPPPKTLNLNGGGSVQWDWRIEVTGPTRGNKPDILLTLFNGKRLLIEVTVCGDALVSIRHQDKTWKYQTLARAMAAEQRGAHPEVVAFALGVTGAVSVETTRSVDALRRAGIQLHLETMQMKAATGSARIVRKLMASRG